MLATPRSDQDNFLQLVTKLYGELALKDGLRRARALAWERFQEIGLPSRAMEVYRYIRLRNFFSKEFKLALPASVTPEQIAPFIYPESCGSYLVFVNGYYEPSLSDISALPSKVVVSPLSEAILSYGTFLNNHWTKAHKEEKDPFAALNAAAHPQGTFIYVPPQTVASSPIQILNIVTEANALSMPRILLFAGRLAEVTLCERLVELNCRGYCQNAVTELVIEEGASVKCILEDSSLSDDAWHFNALRATLKRDSRLKVVSFTDGAMTVRNDYSVALTGENGDACLNGVCMLDEKREAHTNILIDHQAPSCRSNQLFKSVLTDISRSSFEGKIYVRQAAQKTEAYQLNNNLILSDKASADSKPNLEIFADDVKASHGATIGQLDPDQLFYCETRGYPADEARNLLIHGFCEEVIDLIALPSVLQRLSTRARRFLA
jgi:Fe-S cluster assembly protein SufD